MKLSKIKSVNQSNEAHLFLKRQFAPLIPSRYNQIVKLSENQFAVFNPLSGAFDVAGQDDIKSFQANTPKTEEEKQYWLSRGYFFESDLDQENYISRRYQEHQEETSQNETQFLLIFSYGCNFQCSYCYERGVEKKSGLMSFEMIDAFVNYVISYSEKNKKKVYVTLFGGEPLLPVNKERFSYLVKRLGESEISFSLVTNGYYLEDFLPLLSFVKVREIQISLDGDELIHNQRRFEKEGQGSFSRILAGAKKALEMGYPVHARLITDKTTLPTFPELAKKLDSLGFFGLEEGRFKVSLGRNYELIEKDSNPDELYLLDEMIAAYVDLSLKEPILKKLYQPSFFGIRETLEKKEMYLPNFDSCPAGKHEFVFDYTGNIYGCTASCGREGFELGTYYPKLEWNEETLNEWKSRSILTIPECVKCDVGVVCGGGCGVIAKDRNNKVLSPNCKPVKKIMEMGIQYYSKDLLES